jgi:hypothetical protein
MYGSTSAEAPFIRRRLAVFADTPARLSELAAHADVTDVDLYTTRHSFVAIARQEGCGLVVVGDLDTAILAWMRETSGTPPYPRLVVVAPLTSRAARLWFSEPLPRVSVVWGDALERLRQVDALLHGDALAELTHYLVREYDPAPIVRTALRHVSAPAPPSTVASLASCTGASPATLRYHWRNGLPAVPLKGLLSWAVLLRAVKIASEFSLDRASAVLEVHPRTLQRIAGRLLGTTFAEAASDASHVDFAFWRWADTFVAAGTEDR